MAIPIAITVEGANTLTRSLIIFGQGLTRSHPHLLDIIRSIQAGDDQKVSHDAKKNTIIWRMEELSLGFVVLTYPGWFCTKARERDRCQ